MEAFGSLEVLSANEHLELLVEPVAKALAGVDGVGVTEIDPSLSDTAAFCEHYGIGLAQAANCIVLKTKGGEYPYVALMVLGSTHADVNGVARYAIGAKVSFAPMEEAVVATGMEHGAVTPIGLPPAWPILIDKAVADSSRLVIGSGVRSSKLVVSGAFLVALPNARIIDGLAK